jgi:hypothetical protein
MILMTEGTEGTVYIEKRSNRDARRKHCFFSVRLCDSVSLRFTIRSVPSVP